ncbi:MAG: hypothetical protein A3H01_00990 [Candidatus Wildermuthbacteria bacterium RIFCSPLOWO2_12_FULL_40_9]|uniref:Uncharacterized protein n=2 Tax=Candidatus Wildermuthiibacteriota TaxID=1817923 RepID=A0A1G2RDM4_9BACT|nr:MAG: hypothetical protein A3F15_02210 [Candidatus Wildermuthbacteria bacterium RIFCSPHIGHO2_12_FULL_40_12]OHA76834.1 MAG: hypothetical protein A3H01_00990 [Candidatus Wildermuthbacteria bacterium RIFCSPLOWO2_12_FULL_40_9]
MEGARGRNFFARSASWRGGLWFFLGIFDKVSSSEIVNILHIQTKVNFRIFLMGFRNGNSFSLIESIIKNPPTN